MTWLWIVGGLIVVVALVIAAFWFGILKPMSRL